MIVSPKRIRLALLAIALLSFCHAAAAEEVRPMAVLVGGQSLPADLQTIEPDGTFRFASDESGERVIAPKELVRWGHPVDPSESRLVVLADASQIAAVDWTVSASDESLSIDESSIAFKPSLIEQLELPRHLVRAILLQLPADPLHRGRLLEQVRSYSADEDSVFLAGGDSLTGRVIELKNDGLSLKTSLGPVDVPLERITAILFDALLAEPSNAPPRQTLVGLSDGSLLAARKIVAGEDRLEVVLDGDVVVRSVTPREIVFLQPLGGDVTYLSDIEPHRYVHVPYLDLQWPLVRDRNVLGGELRAGGRRFLKGLGVHSAARLVYRLDGEHEHFAAAIAIDDSAGRRGSAIFRVLLAEGDAWREAYTSETIRGGDPPVPISVLLGEAKGLALVVDYADRGDELDHADWLDARLE